MPLMKWEPMNELDRFFEERPHCLFARMGWDLATDVYKEDNLLIAQTSIPGVTAEEVEVSIENDILTISGERKKEKETKSKQYYSKEIRRGSFSRSVVLPYSVDAKKAEAVFREGMLTVKAPILKDVNDKGVKITIAS